tara:strand:- start:282 stop:431 length:150 start_codon:yes stop_codon:yes gene_type:complete
MRRMVLVALILITGCAAPKKGYDYRGHSKKGKSVKYRGDLTKYKCGKGK